MILAKQKFLSLVLLISAASASHNLRHRQSHLRQDPSIVSENLRNNRHLGRKSKPPVQLTIDEDGGTNRVSGSLLGLCQGNCSNDDDCEGDYVCFIRTTTYAPDEVPGCGGIARGTADYCVESRYAQKHDQLTFVGQNTRPLGECAGDCDSDDDCYEGLVCYQRDGGNNSEDDVAFCGGEPQSSTDYCVRKDLLERSGKYLNFVSQGEGGLSRCQGDCDEDGDCEEGLYCFQRNTRKVPNCLGAAVEYVDYCTSDELPKPDPAVVDSKDTTGNAPTDQDIIAEPDDTVLDDVPIPEAPDTEPNDTMPDDATDSEAPDVPDTVEPDDVSKEDAPDSIDPNLNGQTDVDDPETTMDPDVPIPDDKPTPVDSIDPSEPHAEPEEPTETESVDSKPGDLNVDAEDPVDADAEDAVDTDIEEPVVTDTDDKEPDPGPSNQDTPNDNESTEPAKPETESPDDPEDYPFSVFLSTAVLKEPEEVVAVSETGEEEQAEGNAEFSNRLLSEEQYSDLSVIVGDVLDELFSKNGFSIADSEADMNRRRLVELVNSGVTSRLVPTATTSNTDSQSRYEWVAWKVDYTVTDFITAANNGRNLQVEEQPTLTGEEIEANAKGIVSEAVDDGSLLSMLQAKDPAVLGTANFGEEVITDVDTSLIDDTRDIDSLLTESESKAAKDPVLPWWAWFLIAIGILFVLALTLSLCCHKRRARPEDPPESDAESIDNDKSNPLAIVETPTFDSESESGPEDELHGTFAPRSFDDNDYEIPPPPPSDYSDDDDDAPPPPPSTILSSLTRASGRADQPYENTVDL